MYVAGGLREDVVEGLGGEERLVSGMRHGIGFDIGFFFGHRGTEQWLPRESSARERPTVANNSAVAEKTIADGVQRREEKKSEQVRVGGANAEQKRRREGFHGREVLEIVQEKAGKIEEAT